MPRPAILFLYGASGAGKSATVRALSARALPGICCHQFDDIGVPSIDVMNRDAAGAGNFITFTQGGSETRPVNAAVELLIA